MTALPLFHGAARMMMVGAALWSGQTVVVEREFRPASFLERVTEVGATIVGGVGAMGVALLSLPPSPYDRSRRLRLAVWIPFTAEQQLAFEQRFAVNVTAELYGQTECLPVTFSAPGGDRNRASAGRPAPDLEVLLVDDEDRAVRTGEVGEIVVRPANRTLSSRDTGRSRRKRSEPIGTCGITQGTTGGPMSAAS